MSSTQRAEPGHQQAALGPHVRLLPRRQGPLPGRQAGGRSGRRGLPGHLHLCPREPRLHAPCHSGTGTGARHPAVAGHRHGHPHRAERAPGGTVRGPRRPGGLRRQRPARPEVRRAPHAQHPAGPHHLHRGRRQRPRRPAERARTGRGAGPVPAGRPVAERADALHHRRPRPVRHRRPADGGPSGGQRARAEPLHARLRPAHLGEGHRHLHRRGHAGAVPFAAGRRPLLRRARPPHPRRTVGHRWRPDLPAGPDAPTDAQVSLWAGVGIKA